MNKIDDFIEKRRSIAAYYDKAFGKMSALITPCEKEDRKSGYHLYVIKLVLEELKVSRKEIFEALRAENIGVNVHYIPVYYHPYYRELGYKKGICPTAEKVYEQIITLPLFPKMTDQDAQDVVKAVEKVIAYYKR